MEAANAAEPTAKAPQRGRGAAKRSAGRGRKVGKPAAEAKPATERPSRKKSAAATKQKWPKDLAEQTRAVRGVLAAAGDVMTAADVARAFKHAKAPRVEEILDTLVALGHARRTDSGYAPV